ncbi:MAG: hypothetical protein HY461_01325 [Parcubacteria group bacterium]|nr:hypothetical protein [Parcubacteria group bacterium]
MKYFISVVIVVIVAAIITGLVVIGSPKEARLRRFDDLRVQNLQFIQDQVFSYWVDKKTVPNQLEQLNDDIRGVRVPMDPATGQPYAYEKKGSEQFTLCAEFSTAIPEPANARRAQKYPSPPYYGYFNNGSWEHEAGKQCFDRTIDKDRYQKEQQIPPVPAMR